MNKFTDIFANFIEGFSFRQGSQDVKQVKKGAFLKAFTITLIIGLIGEYAVSYTHLTLPTILLV